MASSADPQSTPTTDSSSRTEPGWYGVDMTNPEPERRDDPYPAIHQLRSQAPVNLTPLGFWRLSRYEDCVRLLRQVPCGVRHLDGTIPWRRNEEGVQAGGDFMLQQDPPTHTRLRKLVSKAFTPRATESWRTRAREIADEQLDRGLEAGRMDLVADLALPVPSTLICEMLGVPVVDRPSFTRWTSDATHALAGVLSPPEMQQRAMAAALELGGYFEGLIAERRKDLRDDLLSVLIRAEEEGDRLSAEELLVQAIGLLIAGFETTIGLIGNGAAALIRNPDQLEKLRRQPERIENAVEECLRYDGPIGLTIRVLHADAEFGGFTIPADTQVLALLWGANRDPAVFPDPDRFDLERPNSREHLAFGGGAHLCLGAHLARMEAQEALGAMARRTCEIGLEVDTIERGPSLFRVPAAMPALLRAA